jgi:hypothetical protein
LSGSGTAFNEKITKGDQEMERQLRGIAGFFVLVSLLLAHFVHPAWLWFTAFVGLNLFQSAFTNWCPMMWILKKCGVK